MSLMRTLGKIAMGVVVAKGMGKMMNSRQGGSGNHQSGAAGTGGIGGMLGNMLGSGSSSGSGSSGGLGDMLGKMLGGQSGTTGSSGGGLGSMLGGKSGGMGDLGALLGGRSAGGATPSGGLAGGLGGLLESINRGGAENDPNQIDTQAPPRGSFGDLLNSNLRNEVTPEPKQADEDHARLLIQAMINAAKSDGHIDQEEKQKIVAHLGDDLTEEDKRFVLHEMQSPLDVDAFIRSVPSGHEQEVYLMSLMGIDLDHQDEAKYLDKLRAGLNLSEGTADAIHRKLGEPTLYS